MPSFFSLLRALMVPVLLYVPNLIGYTRIILAFAAFFFAQTHPLLTLALYFSSFILDAFDGLAARHFNQSTKFGALLDMITDRFATTCLCLNIGALIPQAIFPLQVYVSLDIASHWVHMYSSLLLGNDSHKKVSSSNLGVVRLYYTSRTVLSICCMFNEVFFMSLYACAFWEKIPRYVCFATAPVALFKSAISVFQLGAACHDVITVYDEKHAKTN